MKQALKLYFITDVDKFIKIHFEEFLQIFSIVWLEETIEMSTNNNIY